MKGRGITIPTKASRTLALQRVSETPRTPWTFPSLTQLTQEKKRRRVMMGVEFLRYTFRDSAISNWSKWLSSNYLRTSCLKEWPIFFSLCCDHIRLSSLWKEITRLVRSWCLQETTPILICQPVWLWNPHYYRTPTADQQRKQAPWKIMQDFEPMETWHIGSFHLRTDSAPDSPSYSPCHCLAPIYAIISFFVAAQSWQIRATRGNGVRQARTQEGRNFLENWTTALCWKPGPHWMSLLPSEEQAISANKVKPPLLTVTGLTRSWKTWVLRKNMGTRSCPTR